MNQEQVDVWEAMANIGIKLLLAISSIVAFFIVLYFILNAKDEWQAWKLTALDGMLSYTNYKIIAHYFPAIQATAKRTNNPKKQRTAV